MTTSNSSLPAPNSTLSPHPQSPLHKLRLILEMIRFSHTLFALPFALLSAAMAWKDRSESIALVNWLLGHRGPPDSFPHHFENKDNLSALATQLLPIAAQGQPPIPTWTWQELLGILLCMVFARSTAMAFNRLVDRRLDAQNPRTAGRHLPAGTLSVATVTTFAVVCALLFIASTLLFLPNWLPLYLSVPVLLFLCGYSLAKRFTMLAHVWLGTALALAPVAAWIALRGEIAWPPLLLGGTVLLWVTGFDIIYACQDYEVDRRLGLHSIPARLGVPGALRLAALCHAGMVALLIGLPGVYPPFGTLWLVGVGAVAVLLVYEHLLVRPDDLSRVNTAFFNVNAVVSLGLLALGVVDLMV